MRGTASPTSFAYGPASAPRPLALAAPHAATSSASRERMPARRSRLSLRPCARPCPVASRDDAGDIVAANDDPFLHEHALQLGVERRRAAIGQPTSGAAPRRRRRRSFAHSRGGARPRRVGRRSPDEDRLELGAEPLERGEPVARHPLDRIVLDVVAIRRLSGWLGAARLLCARCAVRSGSPLRARTRRRCRMSLRRAASTPLRACAWAHASSSASIARSGRMRSVT